MKASAFWILLALMAATLEPVPVKIAYNAGVDAWQLLFLKNVFAALTILPATRGRGFHWPGWRGLATVASVSLQLMLTNLFTLLALCSMSVVTVMTLIKTTPVFVALANQWLGRDRLTGKFWIGLVTCMVGGYLSLDGFSAPLSVSPVGLLFVLGAILSSTVYRTRMEVITRTIPPIQVSTYIFLVNGTVSLLFLWPFLAPIPHAAYPIGLGVGVAAAVANVAFLYALAYVGSTNISVFNLLQRPLVLIIAALILHERLTAIQLVGTAMVLVGVTWAQVKRAPSQPATSERQAGAA